MEGDVGDSVTRGLNVLSGCCVEMGERAMVDNEGFQTVSGSKKRSRAMRSPSGEGSPSVVPLKVRSRNKVIAASPSSENRFRSLEPGHESDDELDASQEAVVIRDNAAATVAARKSGQG